MKAKEKLRLAYEAGKRELEKIYNWEQLALDETNALPEKPSFESWFFCHESCLPEIENEWIPVTDRLPSPDEDVIVCADGRTHRKTHNYSSSHKLFFPIGRAFHTHRVTHWMPLPSPPLT